MDNLKLSDIKAMILDMDGVLWRDDQPIGDLSENFSVIMKMGISFVLATNNASRSIDQYQEKLRCFGVSLEKSQIITSAQASAYYLKRKFPNGGAVFAIGEIGLIDALKEQGFHHSDLSPLAVVVGLDRSINYEKLEMATLLIRASVPFVATNPDRTFPTPKGLVPGAGAILAALEAATDVKPIVIGKPSPEMYRIAIERLDLPPHQTIVIGDRLETDIAGGQSLGCMTGLVLSGVTTREKAYDWDPPPDLIADDLAHMLKLL